MGVRLELTGEGAVLEGGEEIVQLKLPIVDQLLLIAISTHARKRFC